MDQVKQGDPHGLLEAWEQKADVPRFKFTFFISLMIHPCFKCSTAALLPEEPEESSSVSQDGCTFTTVALRDQQELRLSVVWQNTADSNVLQWVLKTPQQAHNYPPLRTFISPAVCTGR